MSDLHARNEQLERLPESEQYAATPELPEPFYPYVDHNDWIIAHWFRLLRDQKAQDD